MLDWPQNGGKPTSTDNYEYSDTVLLMINWYPDPQKAESMQAMIADIFGENCGHLG